MKTFFDISSRFLWPIQFRKISYLKYFLQSVLVGINLVIHVLFLEKISHSIEDLNREYFNDILLYYFIYIFVFEIINFSIKKWGWMNVLPQGIADIYNKYLNKYIKLDNNRIEVIGTGKIIGIIQNGAHTWAELLCSFIEKGTSLLVSLIFTIYMVSKVKYYYGIGFVILMLIFFYLSKKANDKLGQFRKERYELRNLRLKYLVKILMSKMEVLQSNKINSEMIINYEIAEKISYVSKQMSTYRVILKRISQFGIAILLLLSFWYLGNNVFDGTINISILIGLTGTLIIMQKSISEFISFYVELSKQFVNIEKLWDFFDETPEISGYDTGKDFIYKSGDIQIKNINYGYSKDKLIFKDFYLNISGEKITAFVGPSGGGKSTLVKLISGYIKASSGEIIIDGQKLSKTSLKTYYKDIGYLTQEPSVSDGTILDNLTYSLKNGKSLIKELEKENKKLNKIIELAKCEFIYDLPNGLNTQIGERGIRLSGGQKQRLAIAKIFLKDPKIIILDEPTSALDSFSEQQITKAMNNLFYGRTVIIIAHRLQTVKHADEIVVIESGEVIERGNHSELIKKKGPYKRMLDLQSGF